MADPVTTPFQWNSDSDEACVAIYEAQKIIDDLRAEAEELPEMSLDEINAEISAARAEMKMRE